MYVCHYVYHVMRGLDILHCSLLLHDPKAEV